jgi:hypothetical protein
VTTDQTADVLSHPLTLLFVASVLGVLVTLATSAVRSTRHNARVLERLEERVLPHFDLPHPGQPDVSLPAQVQHIAREVSANHGKSIKDVIDRLDREAVEHRAATDERFAAIEKALHDLARPPLSEGA